MSLLPSELFLLVFFLLSILQIFLSCLFTTLRSLWYKPRLLYSNSLSRLSFVSPHAFSFHTFPNPVCIDASVNVLFGFTGHEVCFALDPFILARFPRKRIRRSSNSLPPRMMMSDFEVTLCDGNSNYSSRTQTTP